DQTEALLYIQAPYKTDLAGDWSYQATWAPMWHQALSFAVPEKVTPQEKAWRGVVEPMLPRLQAPQSGIPTRLEWAKKLDRTDMRVLEGTAPYDRQADPEAVKQLKLLRGHLREGQWLTKLRKTFRKGEMTHDLEFARATLGGRPDDMEYVYILPTSPP
ncbi:MAG TPA: hypothetical protein VFU47_13590, partial [Armatimonadota bacterium]|nr:hypothetical protein [Armatimonadota bacterium]